jgi:hypothetical protein
MAASGRWFDVRVCLAALCVGVVLMNVYADQVEFSVVHAALCAQGIGKSLHSRYASAKQYGFNAVHMVQMRMHA